MPSRRSFSQEFKADAAGQVIYGGKSIAEVCQELDLTDSLLRKWVDRLKARASAQDAFPGHGRLPTQEDELRRLRRENAQLRDERDILKKAAAYFAKHSK
jgi:transposase